MSTDAIPSPKRPLKAPPEAAKNSKVNPALADGTEIAEILKKAKAGVVLTIHEADIYRTWKDEQDGLHRPEVMEGPAPAPKTLREKLEESVNVIATSLKMNGADLAQVIKMATNVGVASELTNKLAPLSDAELSRVNSAMKKMAKTAVAASKPTPTSKPPAEPKPAADPVRAKQREVLHKAVAEHKAKKAAAAKATAKKAPAPKKDGEYRNGLPKGKATGPECGCGCGQHTHGGRFCQGHDARYHAALRAAGKKIVLMKDEAKKTAAK